MLARYAHVRGARYVYVSTDYVYSGNREAGAYAESDTPDPVNVYGESKALGERLVTDATDGQGLIARVCGLYGATGCRAKGGMHFVRMVIDALRAGTPLSIVGDQICQPTSCAGAARGILRALEAGVTGIIHATGDGETSWYQFACNIARLRECGIHHITETATVDGDLARPRRTVLGHDRLRAAGIPMPRWFDLLVEYLEERDR
jgi:dTDP-4-dehydrorhamnose reductase